MDSAPADHQRRRGPVSLCSAPTPLARHPSCGGVRAPVRSQPALQGRGFPLSGHRCRCGISHDWRDGRASCTLQPLHRPRGQHRRFGPGAATTHRCPAKEALPGDRARRPGITGIFAGARAPLPPQCLPGGQEPLCCLVRYGLAVGQVALGGGGAAVLLPASSRASGAVVLWPTVRQAAHRPNQVDARPLRRTLGMYRRAEVRPRPVQGCRLCRRGER
mmetsp:Transcript_4003/g.14144  ORF Transcript_4003/g.14144 Transcript_4003/m.14144 type:complete len:218 (+) Transcript_4003:516-1169(+)